MLESTEMLIHKLQVETSRELTAGEKRIIDEYAEEQLLLKLYWVERAKKQEMTDRHK